MKHALMSLLLAALLLLPGLTVTAVLWAAANWLAWRRGKRRRFRR
jgi:hypothetical protein